VNTLKTLSSFSSIQVDVCERYFTKRL